MAIGFALRNASRTDYKMFKENSWRIDTLEMRYYERGNIKRYGPNDRIGEGALVSVEKDFCERSLKFRQNKHLIWEKMQTGLDDEDFNRLVGCVVFYDSGDEVEIIQD